MHPSAAISLARPLAAPAEIEVVEKRGSGQQFAPCHSPVPITATPTATNCRITSPPGQSSTVPTASFPPDRRHHRRRRPRATSTTNLAATRVNGAGTEPVAQLPSVPPPPRRRPRLARHGPASTSRQKQCRAKPIVRIRAGIGRTVDRPLLRWRPAGQPGRCAPRPPAAPEARRLNIFPSDPPSIESALTLLDLAEEHTGVAPPAAPVPAPIQTHVSHADAPYCMQCGVQMQRAGSCHACPSCGSTSGCS